MYTIKLVRRGNKINVKHVTRNLRFVKQNRSLKFSHTGARGPQGQKGEKGDTGVGIPAGGLENQVLQKASDADYDYKWLQPTFSDLNYTQEFSVTDIIAVNHNLNKYPSVTIIDSAGDEVEGEVFYMNTNQVIVRFTAPFSGRITCN